MAERILLIEDDPRLAEMVSEYLGEAGFRVSTAATGRAGLERLAREPFDALVLDLMLPDMDGLDVCRELRTKSDTPVLMLTARGDAADRIVGLELGADDYLPKPFQPRELLARLRAILRRGRNAASRLLRFGRLEIDRDALAVRRGCGQRRAHRGDRGAVRGEERDVGAQVGGKLFERRLLLGLWRAGGRQRILRNGGNHFVTLAQWAVLTELVPEQTRGEREHSETREHRKVDAQIKAAHQSCALANT